MNGYPVLFLDVDGVLNSLDWFTTPPLKSATTLDPVACKRIRRVVEQTGARIVLSSSWRHSEELVNILRSDGGFDILDKTPRIDDAPRQVVFEGDE